MSYFILFIIGLILLFIYLRYNVKNENMFNSSETSAIINNVIDNINKGGVYTNFKNKNAVTVLQYGKLAGLARHGKLTLETTTSVLNE